MISQGLGRNVTLALLKESSTAGLIIVTEVGVGQDLTVAVQAIQFVITLASVHLMSVMIDLCILLVHLTMIFVQLEPMQKLELKKSKKQSKRQGIGQPSRLEKILIASTASSMDLVSQVKDSK
jgi:hypothetical protein